ncbi:MAG: cytoplasmic protein [Thermodesulfobacteriota bacterium]|nr:cytoplasmic protein [Thermodesulfobacteriota bacterium]
MLKNDLILRNPLRLMGFKAEEILTTGGFGAVLARAGVGKTSFLVQLSLNSLLKNKNVLHISLNDPVNKVNLWYREVLTRIAEQSDIQQTDRLIETILPHRFIMTFRVEGFSVPKLEERLSDLTEQDIFSPQMLIIDGLPFDDSSCELLTQLKNMAQKKSLYVWFTMQTHRDEAMEPGGIPARLIQVADLFEVVVQLQPKGKEIHVKALKGEAADSNYPSLLLDPATMLIKDQSGK